MNQTKPNLPQKDGAKKAAAIFESNRKKVPSDGLVKIISEIPTLEPEKVPKSDDKAAKEADL
jgi:hypothetical protein